MLSFSGDKLKWNEFWDSFESAIHKNKKLPKIEKFNYLKSKLSGDAQKAISGLPLSNDNYDIAIDILKTRFGRDQELVDLHYTQLINLQPATNKINSLRSLLNDIEKHMRCLSVMKQNIEQDVFVAMIRAKLPDEVLFQLEMVNGYKNKWTVEKLRERLDDYITARERSEQQIAVDTVKHNYRRSYQNPETPNKWNSNTQTKGISRNFFGACSVSRSLGSNCTALLYSSRDITISVDIVKDVTGVMSVPISDRS